MATLQAPSQFLPEREVLSQPGAALSARPFLPADAHEWDALVRSSINGTFMHTRRFISYHGERFDDCSVVFTDENGALVGVLPAAVDPGDQAACFSHPGLTYGGIVHDGSLQGERMEQAMLLSIDLFRLQGRQRLRYKAVPYIYHRSPAQDDLYWLHRLGGVRYRCDLSATIDLDRRAKVSPLRRRNIRRAERAGLAVVDSAANLPRFWDLLELVLAERHRVHPVHSLAHIQLLAQRFPEEVRCIVAEEAGELVAGSVLFVTETVVHAQYYASSPRGRQLRALDLVIEHSIELTRELGRRYYDLGVSTPNGGRELNDGLSRYKTSFGAGCTVYECYELRL